MNCSPESLRLYAVTDRAWSGDLSLEEQVRSALKGGVTLVQVREKSLDMPSFLRETRSLIALCHAFSVPCIIDDNVDVAIRSGADGVHIGQDDMGCEQARELMGPDAIIGVSVQTCEQALHAQLGGADYLGVGAVIPTTTKPEASTVSRATIAAICGSVDIPVVAIGGIKVDNISALSGLGLAGVAVVSAIFGAQDIEAACRTLRKATEELVMA